MDKWKQEGNETQDKNNRVLERGRPIWWGVFGDAEIVGTQETESAVVLRVDLADV